MIEKRTFARIGLMGNPSDIFFGKTISCCITNFYATVTLVESELLKIEAHKIFDPTEFSCLKELEVTTSRDGYYGGIRLIYATCKRFSEYCEENGLTLNTKNYTIRYDSTIPRQVGLGGSSAIITSLLKSLMEFYGISDEDIPLEIQPNLILSVETDELGINAGLQDRVVKTYGGTVYMDFDKSIMDSLGHGRYERMYSNMLPNLFLAYIESTGKESGRMHNEVRFRYSQGDKEIVNAMATFAEFAAEAKQALEEGDHKQFGKLMNMNFDLRRKIYGDDAIGKKNLQMIEIARKLGAPVKFPGSGGSVFGMYESDDQYRKLQTEYLNRGYKFTKANPQILDHLVQ